MAKDHGPSLKDDKQYKGGDTERDEQSSRAEAIANRLDASSKGDKRSSSGSTAAVRARRAAEAGAAAPGPRTSRRTQGRQESQTDSSRIW